VTLCAFPYYGGKFRYVSEIVPRMPAHQRYVEAFGGGASVLLNKPRSDVEVYNDHDEHLVQFFRVLRQQPDALREWLDAALYSRADHERWARQFYGPEPVDDVDDVTLAGRFFTLRHTQYGGVTKGVSGFSTPKARNEAQALRTNVERLEAVRDRFHPVVVECLDWRALLDQYDGPETFVYLDPPYVGHEHEYRTPDFDSGALVDRLAELKADWMLSFRASLPGLDDVASEVVTFDANDSADGRKQATERLALSFDPATTESFLGPQERLDAFNRGVAIDGGEDA
jgi:DNA adenine methylase